MFINIHTHHPTGKDIEIANLPTKNIATFYSYGIHPNETESNLINSTNYIAENIICIGEIGLDKLNQMNINQQIKIFKEQLIISEELNLPVILHCVKAWNEILQIKKELNIAQPWILHGFRKTSLLDSILNSNTKISIGTAILYDKKLQDCLTEIPLNQLFLETDDDKEYTIEDVYFKVSTIKKLSLQELKNEIHNNFINTFKNVKLA
jgi:TatD DNase family protein